MGSIDIETLSKRERDWIIIQRCIRRRIVRLDGGVRESCHKLLDIPNTLSPGKRGTKGAVVPEKEVKTARRINEPRQLHKKKRDIYA
jgi:hypothetical protein